MAKTCFVVMGFGTKTDYAQNKTFDLNKSYEYIIKPAVEAAGYVCTRADEIPHAGNINAPMYEQLFGADLVIADVSTANLNAFFELGVRYALKPRTTIVISEQGFKIPFDMGQVLIRSYEHLGTGIDYGEVRRFSAELTAACTDVVAADRVDSPVYTFLTQLAPPTHKVQEAVAQLAAATAAPAGNDAGDADADAESLARMMKSAMTARAKGDWKKARTMLAAIKDLQGDLVDPFIVQQLALVTYKSKDLVPLNALTEGRDILAELSPATSIDPETLGLWGAIHKRLSELAPTAEERQAALNESIAAYEKGFVLKHDYYNGINYAFLLNVRAAQSSGDDAVADRVQAGRVRQRVLTDCRERLAAGVKGEDQKSQAETEYWVRATLAEALFGLGQHAEADAALTDAKQMAPESWMADSTQQQLTTLGKLLDPLGAAPASV